MDAFVKLLAGLMLAILLVYMVMAGQFEAFVHPLVIMVTMPLSLIGVAVVLVATGTPFSVVTFVGVIMLAGIVVNNGIVLIDHINQLRASGMERREAVIQGGSDRLRAVLITSGTTITGLLPMALIPGRGAELTADMALTVAGGLSSATDRLRALRLRGGLGAPEDPPGRAQRRSRRRRAPGPRGPDRRSDSGRLKP